MGGKIYRDSRGWLYRVMPGLGGNTYKGRYQQPGKSSWHCMRQLPWRDSQAEAEADLATYAAAHNWQEDKENAAPSAATPESGK